MKRTTIAHPTIPGQERHLDGTPVRVDAPVNPPGNGGRSRRRRPDADFAHALPMRGTTMPHPMPSTLALRWLSLGLLWAWAGCTRYQSCQAPPDCGEGHECLAFRCVPEGGEVVPEKSTRLLLLPDRLSSDVAPALGGTYELGPPHHAALYAAFALPRVRCAELASAFLLLDAAEPAQSPPRPLPLSVRRVRQAWSEREVASGQVPEEGLPEVRGSWLPPLTARVDVTDIVCSQLATDSAAAHGMVVRGLDGELALRVATGVDQKSPPRLELYLKPANPSATTAPSASGAHAARSP